MALFALLVCYLRDGVLGWREMRRFLAIFAVLLVGCSSVAPLALAAAVDETPACCRRDGKHHCQSGMADMAGMSSDSASGLRATVPACPHRSPIAAPAPAGQAEASEFSVPQLPAVSLVSLPNYLVLAPRPALENSERGPPSSPQSEK